MSLRRGGAVFGKPFTLLYLILNYSAYQATR